MPTATRKPEKGDIVTFHLEPYEIEIRGLVNDLLSTQFTVHGLSPTPAKGKTIFVFYSDDWQIAPPLPPQRKNARQKPGP